MNNLRFIPPGKPQHSSATANQTSTEQTATISHVASAHAEFAVHDTFRCGVNQVRHDLMPGHALENRLNQWNQYQEQAKATMYSQIYGTHAPLKLKMERTVVSRNMRRLSVLPKSNLSEDVLAGRDEWFDFEDFLGKDSHLTQPMGSSHFDQDIHQVARRDLFLK